MFGLSILEVVVSMFFIYLFLSLICSVLTQGIALLTNQRGRNLFEGIKNLLDDPPIIGLTPQLYSHGLVAGISQDAANPYKPTRPPPYMSSYTFALVLLDILESQRVRENLKYDVAQQVTDLKNFNGLQLSLEKFKKAFTLRHALIAADPDPLGTVQRAVEDLPGGHTKEALLVLIDKTKLEVALGSNQMIAGKHEIEKLRENIEQWFNDAMASVNEWYERWTQRIQLIIAILLVFAANADTLMLVKSFMRENALRAAINASSLADNTQARQDLLKEAEKLKLPLGWVPSTAAPSDQIPDTLIGWLFKCFGLGITVLLVWLGAPFWLDVLSRLSNLRKASASPGEPNKRAP